MRYEHKHVRQSTFYCPSEKRTTISETGLRNTFTVPSFTVLTFALRTLLSLLRNILISSTGHSCETTSPTLMLDLSSVHFLRLWRVARYSPLHLFLKVSARHWTCFHCFVWSAAGSKLPEGAYRALVFWVKIIAHVKTAGKSRSVDNGTRGLAFITAITSAIKVVNTSCVSQVCADWRSITSRTSESLPAGKSALSWICIVPLSLQQMKHL